MATGPCPRCQEQMQVVAGQDFAVCPHCWSVYRVVVRDGRIRPEHIGAVERGSAAKAVKKERTSKRFTVGTVINLAFGIVAVGLVVATVLLVIAQSRETVDDVRIDVEVRLNGLCAAWYSGISRDDPDAMDAFLVACRDWKSARMEQDYEVLLDCHERHRDFDASFNACVIDSGVEMPPPLVTGR
jgi:hypothetical protein